MPSPEVLAIRMSTEATRASSPKSRIANPGLAVRAARLVHGPFPLILILILDAYAVLAVLVQMHCADLLTSDGECYLRIAEYYAKGDLRRAVFGYWSPLASWLAVPLLWAGLEARHAFRILIALWGALCVVGTWRVARRVSGIGCWLPGSQVARTESREPSTLSSFRLTAAAAGCAALLALEFSVEHRVDLLMAALLLFYLDAAMDERLLSSRALALCAGVLGGLAYLAKLYALPFFAAHFTLTVLIRAWTEGREDCGLESEMRNPKPAMPVRRAALAWASGALGFAVVATPWVAVLSAKYGRLTFGTAAATAYDYVGPGSGDARQQAITGLRRPPEDAPNVWQDASREWPIPEGARQPVGMGEKATLAAANALKILRDIARLDEFGLGLVALALLPVATVVARRERERAFRYAVLLLAVVIYCGGYALIYAEERRYFWFVYFAAVALAFHFAGLLPRLLARLAPGWGERQRRLLAIAVGVVVTVSFVFHPIRFLGDLFRQPPPGREHRLMAERLRALGVEGPLASNNWWDGLHTAYYLDAKYAGMPAAKDPEGIAAEMREAGATTLLVWRDQQLAFSLRRQPGKLELVEFVAAEEIQSLRGGAWVFRLK